MSEGSSPESNWVDKRANLFANGNGLSQKAGVLGSGSRVVQAAQGAASFAVPGDLSDIRSPIRSTIWETLTPGGGRGLRRPGGKERTYRCPEGYQFGGRFTDSKWSTCGRQLFDIPGLAATLRQIAESMMGTGSGIGYMQPNVTPLSGVDATGDVLKSRAAQIPRVGAFNANARNSAVDSAIRELTGNPSIPTMMIRRDGFPMQPVVSVGELRKVPDNRNMEGATFLIRSANIDMLGKEEMGLLSNTGVTSLVYVLPNGSTVKMDKGRNLTVGERRKLGKTVSAAAQIDNSNDPLRRLNSVVSDSGGGISLATDFKKIQNADQVITSGKNKGKKKWVVEAFKPAAGSRRVSPASIAAQAKPESQTPTEPSKKISNLQDAITHINDGGSLADIDPGLLNEAIRRAKVYRQRKQGANRTLFSRNDGGVSFLEVSPGTRFEHLGAHVSSEVQDALGLVSPKVRVTGEGNTRPYLVQTLDSATPDGPISPGTVKDSNPQDALALAMSDYLLDNRGRNPSNLSGIGSGEQRRLASSMNAPSALAGLSAAELKKRRSLDFPDYLVNDGKTLMGGMSQSQESFRRQILEIYEDLLQKARSFNWNSYIKNFKSDGKLSLAEERHLEIVKSIYQLRLDKLSKSKNSFSRLLGLSE